MAHNEPHLSPTSASDRTLELHNHHSLTNGEHHSPETQHLHHLRSPSGGRAFSPQSQRPASFSQTALQELINNPPVVHDSDSRFAGRDWRTIGVSEITDRQEVRFVEQDTSIEDATKVLVESGAPNVVLIREDATSRMAIGTFDYSDLNAYLLLVVGLTRPDEDQIHSFNELAKKGREGQTILLKDVKDFCRREPFITISHTERLTTAVKILGGGYHRVILVDEEMKEVVGVLTQLRLVRFFWQNKGRFSAIDHLYPATLQDLNIGSRVVFAIHGDRPLTDALEIMNNEGITSLPVLDHQKNVIGNISHVDVKLLTHSTALPLLRSSCIHFISVILSERGVEDGKDSYPVFHVSPNSTLAHTVAKLTATRSHRMWITECSPFSSGSSTPSLHSPHPSISIQTSPTNTHAPGTPAPSHTMPHPVSTAGLLGADRPASSGKLSGVISLTDILNLYARASGLHPDDPNQLRRSRRASSASSVRRSMDSGGSRTGSAMGDRGPGVDIGRSPSVDQISALAVMPEKRAESPPAKSGRSKSLPSIFHHSKNAAATSPTKTSNRLDIPANEWFTISGAREAHRRSVASVGTSLAPIDSNVELLEFTPRKQSAVMASDPAADRTAQLRAYVERAKKVRELNDKAAESKKRLEKERKRAEKERKKEGGHEVGKASGLRRMWGKA